MKITLIFIVVILTCEKLISQNEWPPNKVDQIEKDKIATIVTDAMGVFKYTLNPDIKGEKNLYSYSVLAPEFYKNCQDFYYLFDIRPLSAFGFYKITKRSNKVVGYVTRNGNIEIDTLQLNIDCQNFFPYDDKFIVYYTGSKYFIGISGNLFYSDSWLPFGNEPYNYQSAATLLERRCFMFGVEKVDKIPGNEYKNLNIDSLNRNLYKGLYWEFEAYASEIQSKVLLRLPKDVYWDHFELIYYVGDLNTVPGIELDTVPKRFGFYDNAIYEIKYIRKNVPKSLNDIKPQIKLIQGQDFKEKKTIINRYTNFHLEKLKMIILDYCNIFYDSSQVLEKFQVIPCNKFLSDSFYNFEIPRNGFITNNFIKASLPIKDSPDFVIFTYYACIRNPILFNYKYSCYNNMKKYIEDSLYKIEYKVTKEIKTIKELKPYNISKLYRKNFTDREEGKFFIIWYLDDTL